MKKILINVLPAREVRVAVVTTNEGSSPTVLHDLHIEHNNNRPLQGNIYKAKVSAVKDELNAAFVDYGDVKQGLLALSRVEPLTRPSDFSDGAPSEKRISDYVKVGDDVLVQVDKDSRADKGASLTTRIQLHGQHIVFTTNRPRNRISRMITGPEREEMNRILSKVSLPKDAGLVVRTSAGGKDMKTLQQDVNECIQLLDLINQAYKQSEAPRLLYEENNMVNTVLRDNLHAQIEEILVDDEEVYQQTVDFVNNFMPDFEGKILLYEDALPLFTRNKIEKQSNRVFDRQVTLPSGGQIVLDPTEAFLAVDVNSAKSKYKNNFSDMVLNTNLQAVDELFNQLCLRDIGGLVVVDFIDMNSEDDIRKVQERVERACQKDRHRTKCEPISKFGLMQLQRRRTKSSIYDTAFEKCDTCSGYGRIRTVSSIAHHIFHELEAKCYDKKVTKIRTHVTPDVAAFLTNELRSHLSVLEIQSKSTIEIIPDLDDDNSTYVTHSYRSQHSNKPRETESYAQGKASGSQQDRKRNGTRASPAKSIETAAVSRSDIEKTNKSRRSRSRSSSKSDGRSARQDSRRTSTNPFRQAIVGVGQMLGYLHRRLFMVAETSSNEPTARRRTRERAPTKERQTRPTAKTGAGRRQRPQRATAERTSSSRSTSADAPREKPKATAASNRPQSARTQRRSSESSARETAQSDKRTRDNQRSRTRSQRKSDDTTEAVVDQGLEQQKQQRQRPSSSSQDARNAQGSQTSRTRSDSAKRISSGSSKQHSESTTRSSEPDHEVQDSNSPTTDVEQSVFVTEQVVLSTESHESEQTEAVSVGEEGAESISGADAIEERSESNTNTLVQSSTEELDSGEALQDSTASFIPPESESTDHTLDAGTETELDSSNGQDDDDDASRASNDPRNQLRESVDAKPQGTIEIS
ncbi:MAG: Rne/Rng family ribonuclease [Gammaproteobacteria bacterium]|nr:Rne/Rng family ribonuclease [Gammaproteobacteria bacterium]